jgi:NADPH:quinone reductase-like Zn-dependent oxidoreductase
LKAAVYAQYGPPDVLQIRDVERPAPKDDQVLLEVRAASLNPLDYHLMRGTPHIARLMFGLRKPRLTRPGLDVAGRVEAVGRRVTQFKPGDEVFGASRGACAEYACTAESKVALKPKTLTFEQAASAPVAGLTALQGLRDKGRIRPGHEVLINGAAGGVGTFAVQIAKWFGAHVTGVCSTRNLDMVRSIGADQVIDYTREDFTGSGQRYDLVFDCVWNRPASACRRVLNPNGIYVVVGVPTEGRWIGPLGRVLKTFVTSWFGGELVLFLARIRREDLIALGELMEAGKVTPVIDRRYSLSAVADAVRYLAEGHARGKVVVIPEDRPTASSPTRS